MVRLTVSLFSAFLSMIYFCGSNSIAGDLLSKVELLPSGTIHHIFTNGNVNVDDYPIVYSYVNYAIEDNAPRNTRTGSYQATNIAGRSYDTGTKNPAYGKMRQANPNDEKYANLIDELLSVSSGSPSAGRATKINALKIAIRALAPMTSYGRGSVNVDTWRQQDEMEEQKAETQRIKLDAESERDRAKRDADDAERDAQQARREADQAKNEARWEADRIRTDNIINNRW